MDLTPYELHKRKVDNAKCEMRYVILTWAEYTCAASGVSLVLQYLACNGGPNPTTPSDKIKSATVGDDLTTASAPSVTTTSGSTPSVAAYGQCGGTGYTGCTNCASLVTCQKE